MRLRERTLAWPVSPVALFAVVIVAVGFIAVYEIGARDQQGQRVPAVVSGRITEDTGTSLRPTRGPAMLDTTEATALRDIVNHLPVMHGTYHCPYDDGSTFTIDFATTSGARAVVVIRQTGCSSVAVNTGRNRGDAAKWDRDGTLRSRVEKDIGPPPTA
jgi:hypothetical protein